MKKIVVFGAGQSGRMTGRLLHGTCKLVAYADNNCRNLQGIMDGVPVISPKEIINLQADKVIVSVLNIEASSQIRNQLVAEGINENDILNINDLRNYFDIRLSTLRLLAAEINSGKIEGSIAELGVYKGYTARELNLLFKERRLYLFDTFEGFDDRDIKFENIKIKENSYGNKFGDTSVEEVRSILPFPEKAVFCKGYFPDSAVSIEDKFALVSLDADLYLPTYEGLRYFYPRLCKGGYILLHDYNSTQFPNVKKAVQEFAKEADIRVIPLCDLHGSAVIL
ncbi:MAG: TylF/MycF/NovP-related O-methyltransferase [Sedimentibacter sp.]|uniref:TylF/MycF/NovP-related O-methyltransferase n=1 Tax=Sedimentibacter sp. TaxID=1960295 RepID=UPI0031592C3E